MSRPLTPDRRYSVAIEQVERYRGRAREVTLLTAEDIGNLLRNIRGSGNTTAHHGNR